MSQYGTRQDLFSKRRTDGLRAVVTGQVGVDKKPYLEQVRKLAESRGQSLKFFHIGDMMYAEAPDVAKGRILDLPLARLNAIRRAVFKDVLAEIDKHPYVVINTHAAFRWKHGLFPAFDHDQMAAVDADVYVTLVDNVDSVHERLLRDHDLPHSLKDILVWREEEILATEILAQALQGQGQFYVFSRGVEALTIESFYRLMFSPETKRAYPSFPMTHVMDLPDTLAEIDAFRAAIADQFIAFDPGDMDENRLLVDAAAAAERGEHKVTIEVHGRDIEFDVAEIGSIARDIRAQIYARDFKLIDQSDMIISYIPELPGGKPGLSSGVERELHHAFETTKEVYIVWIPETEPSPFITETATKIFRTTEEALEHFLKIGYIQSYQRPLLKTDTARERGRFG